MPLMDGGPDQDLNLVGKFIKAPSVREVQKGWSTPVRYHGEHSGPVEPIVQRYAPTAHCNLCQR